MAGQHRNRVLLMSSLALALAPKCPLCLLAYAGLVGSASLSWSAYGVYGAWLAPLTAVSLALTVGALAFQARTRGETGPALLALLASAAILAGKFWLHQKPLLYLGMAALLIAAVRASWPVSRHCPNLGLER
jgi:hypothetical protein